MGTESSGDTKLHEAVRFGAADDVCEALAGGCDPNQIGLYEWGPLHEASHSGDVEIVQLLTNAGADPNKADLLVGSTPVHYAAARDHYDCLVVLLEAGGRYNTCNNDGKTCLDVASNDCAGLLRQKRDADILLSSKRSVKLLEAAGVSSVIKEDARIEYESEDGSSVFDLDTISMTTSDSSRSSQPLTWGPDKVVRLSKNKTFGRIQLSFEYNAKKRTLKIRVWHVLDLLLPPGLWSLADFSVLANVVETSMISRMYVKSYLRPDNTRRTKRKTEEIAVYDPSSASAVTPLVFKFHQPLSYDGVDPQMIADRVVDVAVCVTQRYTRRGYVVATWNMPLDGAIKRLRRETFPMRQYLVTALPDNMQIYPNEPLHQAVSYSNPSLQRARKSATPRTASDPVLGRDHHIEVPSISVTMPASDEDFELEDALRQISIVESADGSLRSSNRSLGSQQSSGSVQVDMPEEVSAEGLEDVIVTKDRENVTKVDVHVDGCESSDETGSLEVKVDDVADVHTFGRRQAAHRRSNADAVVVVDGKASWKDKLHLPPRKQKSSPRGTTEHIQMGSLRRGKRKSKDDFTASPPSPCESLSWDDHEEPGGISMVPIDFEESEFRRYPLEPLLPMATTFDVAEVHKFTGRKN